MLVVLLTTFALTLMAVGVHYFALSTLTNFLMKRDYHSRFWVGFSVLAMLLAHIIEISIFAAGYVLFHRNLEYGDLVGKTGDEIFNDYWYFSFVSYTSLGFGDIVPEGELRIITGIETLTGLILIAWTASFIFMQMHRFWGEELKR
jgi:hypothetical protein